VIAGKLLLIPVFSISFHYYDVGLLPVLMDFKTTILMNKIFMTFYNLILYFVDLD